MQVSWIEPEEMRELVSRLRGGDAPAPREGGWELHTLPDGPPLGLVVEDASQEVQALWGDGGAVVEKPAQETAKVISDPASIFAEATDGSTEETHDEEPPMVTEDAGAPRELDRIRQKLQAIRDKAEEAGLLAHTPETAANDAPDENEPPTKEVASSLAPPSSLIEAMRPEQAVVADGDNGTNGKDANYVSHASQFPHESHKPAAHEVEVIPPHTAPAPREEDARVLSPFKLADYLTPASPTGDFTPAEKRGPPVASAETSPSPVQRSGSIWGVLPKKPEETQLVVKSLVRQESTEEKAEIAEETPSDLPEEIPGEDRSALVTEMDVAGLSAVVLPNDGDAAPRMVIEVPPPAPREVEASFEIPLGAMPDRLQAFSEWAMRRVGTQEFLIVDSHGDVLWGRHVQAGLVVSTMLACTAALRSSAIGAAELLGVIEQPVPGEKKLSVIPCQTCYGLINIAIVRRDTVEEPEAALLRRALIATIEARAPGDEPASPEGAALD